MLSAWQDEKTELLCLATFGASRLILTAFVFAVSAESFTLRSTRSDSSLTFAFGVEGVEFIYVDPKELGIDVFPPAESLLTPITDIYPLERLIRIPVMGLPSREQLKSRHRRSSHPE